MKRIALLMLIAVLTYGLAGCSSCDDKKEEESDEIGFENGFANTEALIQAYLEAIEKRDPQLLKRLFLSADDLGKIKPGQARQIWQAYFMICKTAFMEKNKDYLGQKLEFVEFSLGREIGNTGEKVKIYRSSLLKFKLPDGQVVQNDINFIIEAGGSWKIFGLKYIRDEIQRRGLSEQLGLFEGEAKFKGVDGVRDVNIKVKRMTPTPAESSEPETPAPTPEAEVAPLGE